MTFNADAEIHLDTLYSLGIQSDLTDLPKCENPSMMFGDEPGMK